MSRGAIRHNEILRDVRLCVSVPQESLEICCLITKNLGFKGKKGTADTATMIAETMWEEERETVSTTVETNGEEQTVEFDSFLGHFIEESAEPRMVETAEYVSRMLAAFQIPHEVLITRLTGGSIAFGVSQEKTAKGIQRREWRRHCLDDEGLMPDDIGPAFVARLLKSSQSLEGAREEMKASMTEWFNDGIEKSMAKWNAAHKAIPEDERDAIIELARIAGIANSRWRSTAETCAAIFKSKKSFWTAKGPISRVPLIDEPDRSISQAITWPKELLTDEKTNDLPFEAQAFLWKALKPRTIALELFFSCSQEQRERAVDWINFGTGLLNQRPDKRTIKTLATAISLEFCKGAERSNLSEEQTEEAAKLDSTIISAATAIAAASRGITTKPQSTKKSL